MSYEPHIPFPPWEYDPPDEKPDGRREAQMDLCERLLTVTDRAEKVLTPVEILCLLQSHVDHFCLKRNLSGDEVPEP